MTEALILFGSLILVGGGLSVLLFYLRTGVPPVSTTRGEVDDVLLLLSKVELPPAAKIYELGCGWGTLATALAHRFPDANVVGVEISWVPYLISVLRASRIPNLRCMRADFNRVDLSDASAVTCYLMIAPMVPLARTLDAVLQCGTPVVTVSFFFRNRRPDTVRKGRGLRGDVALYRWNSLGHPGLPPTQSTHR